MVKLGNVLLVGCLFMFGLGAYLYAQKPGSEQLISQNPEYNALSAKLESLKAELQRTNSELSGKIDRVLSNQEAIIKELGVIQVRVTRSIR